VSRGERSRSLAVQVGFFVLIFALWWIESLAGFINPVILPHLQDVLKAFGRVLASTETLGALATTLSTFALAYGGAIVAGIAVGYLVSSSRLVTKTYEPILAAIYTIPLIIFFPTFLLFFGIGVKSKIALGFAAAFFPIALNTIAGFTSVDDRLRTAALTFGATRAQMLRRVLFPGAFSIILTGLRIAFIPCFASVLAGEIIASTSGLGHEISYYAAMMDPARMFAYVFLGIIVAALFNFGLTTWEARRAHISA
jgi:ABC-type nitrate/sulfonate/bicarbonate transport system permease component